MNVKGTKGKMMIKILYVISLFCWTWTHALEPCPLVRVGYEMNCTCQDSKLRCSDLGIHTLFPDLFAIDIADQIQDHPLAQVNISGSVIKNIPNDTFDEVKTRELSLMNLNIQTIETTAFWHIGDSIEGLYLSGNNISVLPEEVFLTLTNLLILSLRDNQLTTVDGNIFSNLINLKSLYLDHNSIHSIADLSFPSSLDTLTLYKNNLKEISSNTFLNLDLKTMNLRENNLETLTEDVFWNLHSLEELDLSWNNLTIIYPLQFQRSTNLRRLDLALNNIRNFHSATFFSNSDLTFLDVSGNQLKSLPLGLFSSLSMLKFLYLHNNEISDVPDNMFQNLNNLQLLHAHRNNLSTISQPLLTGLTGLEELRLDDNLIINIGFGAFDPMGSLKMIDLSYNRWNESNTDPFQANRKLEWVNLKSNLLPSIPGSLLKGLSETMFIDFRYNKIREISTDAFKDTKKLLNLDLSHNWIHKIEANTFKELTNLTYLSLSYNPLQYVDVGAFSGLDSLVELEINYTCMTTLPNYLFNELVSLTTINLKNSGLRTIFNGTFSSSGNLKDLDLSHNQISQIEPGAFSTQTLDKIIISHNQVNSAAVRGLTSSISGSVSHLDLSFNQIEDLLGIWPQIFDGIDEVFLRGNPFKCDCESNTNWIRTLNSLVDYELASCAQPSNHKDYKLVCFPEPGCKNESYNTYPFEDSCNESESVTRTGVNASDSQVSERDICDPRLYTSPTRATTPTTTTPSTTTSSPRTTTPIVPIDIEMEKKGNKNIDITWDVPEANRQNVIGYVITQYNPSNNQLTSMYIFDPNVTRQSLILESGVGNVQICIKVLVHNGSDLGGGEACQDIRLTENANPTVATNEGSPKITTFTLIIVIVSVAMTVLIGVVLIVTCVCLRRHKRKNRAKKVGVQRSESTLRKVGMWVDSFSEDRRVRSADDITAMHLQNNFKSKPHQNGVVRSASTVEKNKTKDSKIGEQLGELGETTLSLNIFVPENNNFHSSLPNGFWY